MAILFIDGFDFRDAGNMRPAHPAALSEVDVHQRLDQAPPVESLDAFNWVLQRFRAGNRTISALNDCDIWRKASAWSWSVAAWARTQGYATLGTRGDYVTTFLLTPTAVEVFDVVTELTDYASES